MPWRAANAVWKYEGRGGGRTSGTKPGRGGRGRGDGGISLSFRLRAGRDAPHDHLVLRQADDGDVAEPRGAEPSGGGLGVVDVAVLGVDRERQREQKGADRA